MVSGGDGVRRFQASRPALTRTFHPHEHQVRHADAGRQRKYQDARRLHRSRRTTECPPRQMRRHMRHRIVNEIQAVRNLAEVLQPLVSEPVVQVPASSGRVNGQAGNQPDQNFVLPLPLEADHKPSHGQPVGSARQRTVQRPPRHHSQIEHREEVDDVRFEPFLPPPIEERHQSQRREQDGHHARTRDRLPLPHNGPHAPSRKQPQTKQHVKLHLNADRPQSSRQVRVSEQVLRIDQMTGHSSHRRRIIQRRRKPATPHCNPVQHQHQHERDEIGWRQTNQPAQQKVRHQTK